MCLFAIGLSFTSCKKYDGRIVCGVDDPTTELQWLKDKMEESLGNPSATLVEEYSWNDSTFILVNQCVGCADSMSEIYNCDGTLRCAIGGIAGFQCAGFDQAVLIKTWN